jgi:hypothetical protein
MRASPKGILSTKAAHRMLARSVTLRHGFSSEPTMEKIKMRIDETNASTGNFSLSEMA